MKDQSKYDEFRSFVTYIDVFTYALALSNREQFDANPDKWHKAVYDIWGQYSDKIPELKRIYFTHRDPLPPHSRQVDRLIKILSMAHEVTIPNPQFPTIDMNKGKKSVIKKREEKRLQKYSHEIRGISKILEQRMVA
jgi:hypothetical protein